MSLGLFDSKKNPTSIFVGCTGEGPSKGAGCRLTHVFKTTDGNYAEMCNAAYLTGGVTTPDHWFNFTYYNVHDKQQNYYKFSNTLTTYDIDKDSGPKCRLIPTDTLSTISANYIKSGDYDKILDYNNSNSAKFICSIDKSIGHHSRNSSTSVGQTASYPAMTFGSYYYSTDSIQFLQIGGISKTPKLGIEGILSGTDLYSDISQNKAIAIGFKGGQWVQGARTGLQTGYIKVLRYNELSGKKIGNNQYYFRLEDFMDLSTTSGTLKNTSQGNVAYFSLPMLFKVELPMHMKNQGADVYQGKTVTESYPNIIAGKTFIYDY